MWPWVHNKQNPPSTLTLSSHTNILHYHCTFHNQREQIPTLGILHPFLNGNMVNIKYRGEDVIDVVVWYDTWEAVEVQPVLKFRNG